MKITNKNLVSFVIIVTLVFFGLATLWLNREAVSPTDNSLEAHKIKLEYLSLKLDVYKAIGIGFLIALLGLLIPNILPEARYEFEKMKEGRKVFSEAKTGIDYLRFGLPYLDRVSAINHINEIHRLKHLADAYIRNDPRIAKWPDAKPYDAYHIIMKYLHAVSDPGINWDKMTLIKRQSTMMKVYVDIEGKKGIIDLTNLEVSIARSKLKACRVVVDKVRTFKPVRETVVLLSVPKPGQKVDLYEEHGRVRYYANVKESPSNEIEELKDELEEAKRQLIQKDGRIEELQRKVESI